MDLVCISSKVPQSLYSCLEVDKQGGQERLPTVQRLDGLRNDQGNFEKYVIQPCDLHIIPNYSILYTHQLVKSDTRITLNYKNTAPQFSLRQSKYLYFQTRPRPRELYRGHKER